MKGGFKVLDSDMHIVEPPDLWQRYLEPAFRDRAPLGTSKHAFDYTTTLEGTLLTGRRDASGAPTSAYLDLDGKAKNYEDGHGHGWDPASQVRAMDHEGIDVAVLFPTRALFTHSIDGMDPALATAIGTAYDNWMYDFCRESPGRLYGAAHVSTHDVESAVVEARRCVEDLGFKAIFLRPHISNGRNWYDPYYDPLWAECQRLGVPVCFHSGQGAVVRPEVQPGSFFQSGLLQHTCAHAINMILSTMSFCGGGILERFPELRVAFLEGNCSWVPWLMWHLDEEDEWKRGDGPDLKLKPSEYFKRQCFVSIECDEWPAKYLDDAGYGHTAVLSTDYPHPDSKYPRAVDSFLKLPFPDDVRRKYLWDNCARLYGLT